MAEHQFSTALMKLATALTLLVISLQVAAASDSSVESDDAGSRQSSACWITNSILNFRLRPARGDLWKTELGDGFRKGVAEAGFEVGFGLGHKAFGSNEAHDFALTKLHLGWMVSDVVGEDRWYRGNWEILGELLVGGQFNPKGAYLVGLTPVLRYNFATGTRWVPFVDAGGGVTATDIGHPDLSTTFQFNSQVGFGVRRLLTRNSALTVQYRFIHVSDAGISQPNAGVNASLIYAGVSWFF
jgi:hypothetical protein